MYVFWSALCQLGLPHIASCTPKKFGIFAYVIIIEELEAAWNNNLFDHTSSVLLSAEPTQDSFENVALLHDDTGKVSQNTGGA